MMASRIGEKEEVDELRPRRPSGHPPFEGNRGTAGGYARSEQPGRDVDGQRQHHRVEEERVQAVRQADRAHGAGGEGHVGRLAGRADDAGEVQEVEVGRVRRAGELQAVGLAAAAGQEELVRVVQREAGLRERPAAEDGERGQRQVRPADPALQRADRGHLRAHGRQHRDGGQQHQHQHGDAAVVLLQRVVDDLVGARARHHAQRQREVQQR